MHLTYNKLGTSTGRWVLYLHNVVESHGLQSRIAQVDDELTLMDGNTEER